MSEEIIRSVQNLINSGKGDSKRLHEILNTLKQGSPLYLSDFRYLESLTSNQTQQRPENKADRGKPSVQRYGIDDSSLFSANKSYLKELREDEDAISILRNRLASGEISIEEFIAIKKAIREA